LAAPCPEVAYLFLGRLVDRSGKLGRQQRFGELVVPRVRRQRGAEIDEVAVEVATLFGDAAQPGETVRIDRVHRE